MSIECVVKSIEVRIPQHIDYGSYNCVSITPPKNYGIIIIAVELTLFEYSWKKRNCGSLFSKVDAPEATVEV